MLLGIFILVCRGFPQIMFNTELLFFFFWWPLLQKIMRHTNPDQFASLFGAYTCNSNAHTDKKEKKKFICTRRKTLLSYRFEAIFNSFTVI